ncbi:hypothetical protein ACWGB8_22885 [Kitasatospora sp. NPDC054939]
MTVGKAPREKQNPLTVVRLLWCGQGQLAFVEIYNEGVEQPEADFLALVNCGGESGYAQASLDYITTKVAARYRKLLNLVVLTSLQQSSLSLLDELGERLERIGARVLSAFVAGAKPEGAPPDTIATFFLRLRFNLGRVQYAADRQSDYRNADGELSWIAEHNGTYFRILASDNRPFVNATVLVIDNTRLTVTLPGGLTYELMSAITAIGGLQRKLSPKRILQLPQYGVLESAVIDLLSSPQTPPRWKTVKDFAKAIKPTGLWVSAGLMNASLDPLSATLAAFSDGLEDADPHTYVSYDLPGTGTETGTWQTRETTKEIRTTVRTLGRQETHGDVVVTSRLRPAVARIRAGDAP